MKKFVAVLSAVLCVAAVCFGFYYVNKQNQPSHEADSTVTEAQKLILKNIDDSYPTTPREVIKLYNKIVKCYYSGEYTEDELGQLADQGLKLFDSELATVNPREQYISSIKAEVLSYKTQKKSMAQTGVCASNDVRYINDGDDSIAYVTASYFFTQDKEFSKTFQEYVLRKDPDGRWKILCFYKLKGEASTDD